MKGKKIGIIIIIVVIQLILFGCSKQKAVQSNTYVQDTDFQYQYYKEMLYGVDTVETDDGYYKLINDMIYYVDKESMKGIPLCGKADCLHDQETGKKRTECNAYVASKDGYLYHSGKKLYVLSEEWDSSMANTIDILYEISMDGTTKDVIYKASSNEGEIGQWMIHRGYFYFSIKKPDENDKEHIAIMRCPLKNTKKLETVCEMNDIYHGEVQYLGAYGNYLYIYNWGFNQDIDNDQTENWVKTLENRWMCYNTVTGEVKELFKEQKKEGSLTKAVQSITFWKDKILFCYYYVEDEKVESEEAKQMYLADLDGENVEKAFLKEDGWDRCTSDGTYLYEDNFMTKGVKEGKKTAQLKVYDTQGEQIDEMEMPVDYGTQMPAGGENCFLLSTIADNKIYIFYMDKTKIGSYKGQKEEVKYCYKAPYVEIGIVNEEE